MHVVPRFALQLCGLVVLGALTTNCAGTTNEPPSPNTAPAITSLSASSVTGGAGYRWSVDDPDGDPLSCALDADGDGIDDVNLSVCGAVGSQSFAFALPGAYASRLTVADDHGHTASASIDVIAAGTDATPPTWLRQFGTTATDHAYAGTTDASGAIALVGMTTGALPGTANAGGSDVLLAAYSASGERRWARQFGTAASDQALAVTGADDGTLTLAGTTAGTLQGATSAGGTDILLARYDRDGNALWTLQFGTGGDDSGRAITTDADGNLVVAGSTTGAFPGSSNAGGTDILVAKVAPDGTLVWARQLGTHDDDVANGIVADASGATTLVGFTAGALPGESSQGGVDIVLARYDRDGNPLWTRQLGTSGNDYGRAITGRDDGTTTLTGTTTGTLPGAVRAGGADLVLATYDRDGNALWTRQLGTSDDEDANAITIDAAGNTTLAGHTAGTLPGHTGEGGVDIVLAKSDPDGKPLWTRQLGTATHDFAFGVSSDAGGGTAVVGMTLGALPGTVNAGDYDILVAYFPP